MANMRIKETTKTMMAEMTPKTESYAAKLDAIVAKAYKEWKKNGKK